MSTTAGLYSKPDDSAQFISQNTDIYPECYSLALARERPGNLGRWQHYLLGGVLSIPQPEGLSSSAFFVQVSRKEKRGGGLRETGHRVSGLVPQPFINRG